VRALADGWKPKASEAGLQQIALASVAEGGCAFVADPVPKWEGALKLVAGDESGFVELRGVEAGREGVVPAVGGLRAAS
jgi:hypothetical protein